MASTTNQLDRARAIWQSCISSAFRTALACTIVACATVYGPEFLTRRVTLPAFSYVTVILIITDATLGDTLRGCWLALYATVQSIGPAILSLWLIGPAKLSNLSTAFLVAVGGFVVVLPESTHLVAKRIALGQIVLTYVTAFIHGGKTEPIMHPVYIAASTALGVFACVLALLFPYPKLASSKLKKNGKLYAENVSERLKLFVKAFCASDKTLASASISQAKSLASKGTKLLKSIKSMQESMRWERLPFNLFKSYYPTSSNKLQDLELPIRGMEMALASISSFWVTRLNADLISGVEQHLNVSLKQVQNWLTRDHATSCSTTVPEPNQDKVEKSSQTLQAIQSIETNLPAMFFIFCLKLLHRELIPITQTLSHKKDEKEHSVLISVWITGLLPKMERLKAAFKCSLSLGLAVLLGLMYSKKDGYWAGLPVAISLASAREATFRVANLKAQGTVLGTVYGVLGFFLFEKFFQLRLMSLLPWFIFTDFLRRSKMYEQAGGLSAVIGAILILGRQNFGTPSEFAIARIVETFIGLFCSTMIDIAMKSSRASTLAKTQLSKCLGALRECIEPINFSSNPPIVEQNQKRLELKAHVIELGKYIGEAEVEPNFWFLPFHSVCYNKLLISLTKMVDLFVFGSLAVTFLEQKSPKVDDKLTNDLKLIKEKLSCFITCLQEITLVKTLKILDNELERNKISRDIEMGKSSNSNLFGFSDLEQDEMEKILETYVQNLKEIVDNGHGIDGEMMMNLSAFGFCMNGLMKESREIRKGIEELVLWENPTNHINMYEISRKINVLNNSM